ncbi:DEAD-box ATP-dependent RNA helicase 38 [Heracleum sosnowskyi]|uniref:RNA helicase n=1 Tax=Heracleum sosnowskyi TaxID=360622 RepID=A0AAD8N417_9APIA|nr:DEAD-box ATP-dependent RNA helicase 38 [Heracleum sosnowskyi]
MSVVSGDYSGGGEVFDMLLMVAEWPSAMMMLDGVDLVGVITVTYIVDRIWWVKRRRGACITGINGVGDGYRELAIQNQEVVERMGKFTGITSVLAVPMEGMPLSKIAAVNKQVIIGTPGTINKWFTARKLSMTAMTILVFDEADHMLAEGGFKQDSERIIKGIVKLRPNCQYKVYCPDEISKIMVIKDRILEMAQKVGQIIIFVRTRNSASMLHRSLVEYGYQVTTIQGAFKQEDRDTIVKEFKEGLTQVLISTDLLARGFDQPQVNLVVNYDLPLQYDPSHRKREPDYEVAEVASWESDGDFEEALKSAGLM